MHVHLQFLNLINVAHLVLQIAIAFGVIFALAFILVLLGPETRVEWGIRDVVNTALEDELKEDTQEKNKGQK